MPYNLHMSPIQIARCNRVLPSSNQLVTTRITHAWDGGSKHTEVDAVVLSADAIRRVAAALQANPEDACGDLDLEYLDATLLSVLNDAEDTNMLFGICL